jgi:Lhr-like helicase
MFKVLLFGELKGLKSDRAIIWYFHDNPADALSLGFDKDVNNNVRIPSRRAVAYFRFRLLTQENKELLEQTLKLIKETSEKFNLELDITPAISKSVEVKESNFQYQKEKNFIEAVETAKKFLSKEIKLNIKPNSKYSKAEMLNVFFHSALENQFTRGGAEHFK